MAGNIKGLTVEIGGDTTKLGKALDGVEKKSKSLSGELGQINKLLKMDPGNADLLAQKQKVLADAVENTSEKLKTLKAANEKAAQSAGNYDAWKEKIDPINAQIEETVKKLKQLKATAETAAADFGVDSEEYAEAAAAVSDLEATLKALRKQAQDVNKEFDNPVSPEQYRALQREIIATEKKLGSYERAAKETAEAVDKLGKSGKGLSLSKTVDQQANDLKKLKASYVDVVAAQGKNSKAAKELETAIKTLSGELKTNKTRLADAEKAADKAAGELDDFADSAKKAEKSSGNLGSTLAGEAKAGLAAVGAACTAAITGLVAAAESTREYRTEMGKLDSAFTANGHSAETASATYKTLQGVIGETDQSVEAAQQISLLAKSEKDAANWAGLAAGVVGQFGDALQPETFYEAANETIKLGESTGAFTQMLEGCGMSVDKFNEGLAKCKTEGEKQAYMLKITEEALGDAGARYKEVNGEIIRANEANDAWMQSLSGVGGAIEPVITDIKLMGASMLSELVPGVQKVADAFRGLMNGDAGAADALGAAFSGLITQLLGKITELAPTLVNVAMSLITTLTTSLISMLPQLVTAGVQIITNILDGLTSAIPQITQALVTMIPKLVQALVTGIPQLIQGGVQLLLALLQAIPQILPPLVAALPQIVMSIINGLLAALPQLLTGAVQFLTAIIQAIPQLISMLVPQIPTIVTAIITGLLANIPVLIQGAVQLLNAIVQAIPLLIQALVPQIPTIVTTIVNELVGSVPVLLDAALQLFMALVQAIPQLIVALVAALPSVLQAIGSVLGALPSLIWGIFTQVLAKVGEWIGQMAGKAGEAGGGFLGKVVEFFKQLPGKIWTFLSNVISKAAAWVSNMASKARTAGSQFLSSVVSFISQLPGKAQAFLSNVIGRVASWASNMASRARAAGSNFINGAVNFIKQLPGKIWTFLSNAVSKVATWGTNMVSKAKSAMSRVVSSVTSTLKSLPSKVLSIGSNLVTGLWNGVSNKLQWLKNKLKSFTNSVLDSIKSFFGVNSPSRETAWVGDMLDQGLAQGVEDNANAPIKAMQKVSTGVLDAARNDVNGLQLERNLQTRTTAAQSAAASAGAGMLEKLDKILAAIEKGQVLTIDRKALIGATATDYDNTLGQRRALAARGAL